MKTTIVSLVLASIVGLMYCSDDSLAVTQEPEDKELRALLTKRRDLAKAYVEAITERVNSDTRERDPISLGRIIQARQSLTRAELELAGSKEERIAILEQALAAYLQFKEQLSVRDESHDAIFQTEFVCLGIQIELYKAKKDQ